MFTIFLLLAIYQINTGTLCDVTVTNLFHIPVFYIPYIYLFMANLINLPISHII
jgi:hypothetical protein